jgi:hypothetical protein
LQQDIKTQLDQILKEEGIKEADLASKFCDHIWTLKMGGVQVGLKGLADKIGIDVDNNALQGVDSIRLEVQSLFNDTAQQFINLLHEIRPNQLKSAQLGNKIDCLIHLFHQEMDTSSSCTKSAEDQLVDRLVTELVAKVDCSKKHEIVMKVAKKNNFELELERQVSNIVKFELNSAISALVDSEPVTQDDTVYCFMQLPQALESNHDNEILSKFDKLLISALKDELKPRVAAITHRNLKDNIQQVIKNLNEPESDLSKSVTNLYDVMEVRYLLHYIIYEKASVKEYPNGTRDKGNEGKTLEDFRKDPRSKCAQLSEAMVVALRLYTTVAYKFMNGPLRDECTIKLPAATYYADLAIKKLRVVEAQKTKFPILWRGIRNSKTEESFMQTGGTEYAFMSTTTDLEVALRYSLSKNPLLFKITPTSVHEMGADVHWLSAFPAEKEILYPPLTFLQPTGSMPCEIVSEHAGDKITFMIFDVKPKYAS